MGPYRHKTSSSSKEIYGLHKEVRGIMHHLRSFVVISEELSEKLQATEWVCPMFGALLALYRSLIAFIREN